LSLDYSPKEGQQAISELLVDPRPTPEKVLERFELYALALKLTRGLAPSQRAALRLHQQNEFSIRKAAKKSGVPEGTLKAQLARGRAKLAGRFHELMARPKIRVSVSRKRTGCPGPPPMRASASAIPEVTDGDGTRVRIICGEPSRI
jgi:predicted DNA-binding protein (UPF0251 family)